MVFGLLLLWKGKSDNLSHLVYSLADAGNLAGRVILVVNALAASHLNGLGGSSELGRGSSLVTGFDRGIYLLDGSLNTGPYGLVPFSPGAVYQNSLFADLMLAKSYTSNFMQSDLNVCSETVSH